MDNEFLASHLATGMSVPDAKTFRKFVLDGGEAPLDTTSFRPCLEGKKKAIAGRVALQFEFAVRAATRCFLR